MPAKLRLLLVEDNTADAEIIARHLARARIDCAIDRVQTEADLLSALNAQEFDLIISDFSLPQFDGLRALEIAIDRAPDVPFIFVSGTIGEERAIEAVRRGATDYVLKTNLTRLSSAVERALREAEIKADQRRSESQRREQEVRLQRLTRTYRMLSNTSSAILRLRNRAELLDEVCRIAHQQAGYDRVVISLIDSNATVLTPHAYAGADSKSLHAADATTTLGADPQSMTLDERAIQTRAPTVVNDLSAEPSRTPREKLWIDQGWQAAAALPLLIDGTAIGTMTLFSKQRDVFDEAEMGVLMELTANLCFALQYLQKDEALHFLAYFDSLTGLAKRQLFCQRLGPFLYAHEHQSAVRTVVVFDVQKLGAINDSLGRYIGDRLIEEIAARIKKAFGHSDCAAYFGGGTFALMLSHVKGDTMENTGRLMQGIAAQPFAEPFQIGGQELRPAIRCGVAFHPEDGDTADALVQNAEAALKAAREDNEKYMMYGLVTQRPTSGTVALEARLTAALDHQEFLLHYQPKVDIGTGRITGFEALLRWQDTQLGLVPPSLFVPLLERSGAIVDVGEWVLQQAVSDIQSWNAQGVESVRIAVNVSPLQLRRRDFVDTVLSRLGGLEPTAAAGLDIEITESMLMQDIELSIRKLWQLREAGIGVAIDDFGTGYSSLRLLSRLPVDTLKIDHSFIQSIADTPNVMTLVATIVSLARAFDMQTVAEGVETAQQLTMLRVINCDQAQGFYLGRPTPAAEVPTVIRRLSQEGKRMVEWLEPLVMGYVRS
ncbi:MAG TPA: EAL domain-containing protein [Steroidobacteraceae bacterium]|nr:EAL domain-containing protein [Steroidobacteraceae bacterium]